MVPTSDEYAESSKAIATNPVAEVAKSGEDFGASRNKHKEHDREHTDADSREKDSVIAHSSQPNAAMEETSSLILKP
ncbi:hypothetical protein AAVH_28014 [Aphelenchoides avenae]|nr:hypothetical protein AAVH_31614 [Aphelenchus avenae]KAH7704781.1 hypothetical protein AAVH_28014 [Aphelenchus avenae]